MANYNSLYNPNQAIINQLLRQKDNIDNILNQYNQPQAPVQNIINTISNKIPNIVTVNNINWKCLTGL